jgi:hypothetical protein
VLQLELRDVLELARAAPPALARELRGRAGGRAGGRAAGTGGA